MKHLRLDPHLAAAIDRDEDVAAAHAEVIRLLDLVRERIPGSQLQKAAIVAMQVAVWRRQREFERWAR